MSGEKTKLSQKRSKLLRRRNIAVREGDGDEVRRVDRLIDDFNRSLKPDERAALITSDTKERSQRSFTQTTAKMRGGVTFTCYVSKPKRIQPRLQTLRLKKTPTICGGYKLMENNIGYRVVISCVSHSSPYT